MSSPYRAYDRKLACSNSRFEVYFDSLEASGKTILTDYLIVRPRVQDDQGIVSALVLPEINNKIGLMRVYRHQFSRYIWQAPAGFMEQGESPDVTALRELKEETGLICSPDGLIHLGSVCSDAGLLEGRVSLYLARGAAEIQSTPEVEIGTGSIEYFSPKSLETLLNSCPDIGGTTLVAGYRYLSMHAK